MNTHFARGLVIACVVALLSNIACSHIEMVSVSPKEFYSIISSEKYPVTISDACLFGKRGIVVSTYDEKGSATYFVSDDDIGEASTALAANQVRAIAYQAAYHGAVSNFLQNCLCRTGDKLSTLPVEAPVVPPSFAHCAKFWKAGWDRGLQYGRSVLAKRTFPVTETP